MAKCPPQYKNLNEIQSFSEQRYATVQWAEQNCENDEYLKQEVDELIRNAIEEGNYKEFKAKRIEKYSQRV